MAAEVIDMQEWVERKATEPTKRDIYKRLGEISIEVALLLSERERLESLL